MPTIAVMIKGSVTKSPFSRANGRVLSPLRMSIYGEEGARVKGVLRGGVLVQLSVRPDATTPLIDRIGPFLGGRAGLLRRRAA